MSKLRLLLSVGAMLSLAAGGANAARFVDQPGNPNSPSGTGIVTDATGFQESGSAYTGGQGQGETESAMPFDVAPPPGTISMRINSFVNEFPMYTSWTGQNGSGTPASNAGNKNQSYGIYGWIRLDFGLDGMTKNGVRYGAFTEIRENNTTAITGGTTPISGGASTSVTSGFAQSPSGDSGDNTLYVRNAEVYVGTDQLGIIRIGTGFSAQTLFETGLFDDFDIGGWISFSSTNIPSNMAPVWPWADEGGEYMAARIGYLSPVIAGFDGGVFFAPNNSGPFDGSGCSAGYGGTGCATQSTSSAPGDITRYRNEFGAALRYRNAFGPVGMVVEGSWTTSGQVNNFGPQKYNGESIGDVGAEVSFNKVLAVGANVMWGDFNGNWSLQPVGGADAIAWTAGVKYTIPQVPLTLGTYYFNYKYQGTTACPCFTQRVSQGLDVGAVYGLGPGVVVIAEYAWGQNYQGGYDFLTSAAGPNSNKVTANVATLGLSVRF